MQIRRHFCHICSCFKDNRQWNVWFPTTSPLKVVYLDRYSRNCMQDTIEQYATRTFCRELIPHVVERCTDIVDKITLVLVRITSFSVFHQALFSEFDEYE